MFQIAQLLAVGILKESERKSERIERKSKTQNPSISQPSVNLGNLFYESDFTYQLLSKVYQPFNLHT